MDKTTTDQITVKLLPLLRKHLELMDDVLEIPMDGSLEELGLNSFGVILLLLELEEIFNIRFPDSLLAPETFRTASTLRDVIESLINS